MTEAKKSPTHIAYSVREFTEASGEEDTEWLKIGVAWKHEDDEGFNIFLDATPVSGRLVVRTNTPKPKAE